MNIRRSQRGATWGGRPGRGLPLVTIAVTTSLAVSSFAVGSANAQAVDSTGAPEEIVATDGAVTTEALTAEAAPVTPTPTYDPMTDGYSMQAVLAGAGVPTMWNQGYTGVGVDVALIDTGVSPVEGLATPGKLIYGPDFSLDSQVAQYRHLDTNGHGTVMAGIIAGRDSSMVGPYAQAPASQYRGVAPDARIVSLKVGVADGGVDVSQVIAAINWVVDNKKSNGLNIKVLSLAYGTNSLQPASVDPLSHAVERAWRAGIVVVAAAGNTGYQQGNGAPGLASPAYNPMVIAVGGYDTMGTASGQDDKVGSYSASSSMVGARRPDVVAPGSHMQGLRVPGSFLDLKYPSARRGERYFRGTGTSEATAYMAGIAALLVQKYPTMGPDQLKKMVKYNARDLIGSNADSEGSGAVSPSKLATAGLPGKYYQNVIPANGTGSLEISRGVDHLTMNGVTLAGEMDIFGKPWAPGSSADKWVDGWWHGSQWTGVGWVAAPWAGSTWSGSTWSGSTWSGSTWSGSTWSGSTWSGSTWSGSTWSGSTWSGSTWSGSTWSGSTWSGSTWSGSTWSSASWS